MLIESLLAGYMRIVARREMNMRWTNGRFEPRAGGTPPRLLYIHVPFCETLCPYCSFHRVRFEPALATRYFECLRREIGMYRDLGFCFDSVYVGGGSPTVLPSELAAVMGLVRSLWPIRNVSVEAHPHHLTPGTIAILKDAGVDRLSVGVQTFNDRLLGKLSRRDAAGTARDARNCLALVQGQFDTVNADMIFNFPQQTVDMVLEDVRILRELAMDQLTFYPLMAGGDDFHAIFGKVDARRQRLLFAQIVGAISDAYESVSGWCFARRRGMHDEYIVAHDEYAGLGSGAFGYINGTLYANSFDIGGYMDALGRSDLPIVAVRTFRNRARMKYDMLMRLFGGSLDLSAIEAKYGRRLTRELGRELLLLRLAGAIVRRDGCFVPTPKGRYYLVVLMKEFFRGANRLRDFLTRGRPFAPLPVAVPTIN